MDSKVKKWLGPAPTHCDLCKTELKDCFIDGRTNFGPWANMCKACHSQVGVGLGTGRGQKYERQGNNWIKTEG